MRQQKAEGERGEVGCTYEQHSIGTMVYWKSQIRGDTGAIILGGSMREEEG